MGKNTFTVTLNSTGQKKSVSVKIVPNLKKFMVHFRRPSGYQGEYGFDWLRDEYIYPIIEVTHDNDGTPIGAKKPLCKDVAKLKAEYKDSSLSPYGKDYYPAWLSIFPHTTTAEFKNGSTMHKHGVSLNIEIEELESLTSDATELLFECSNTDVIITPNKLNLKDLIKNKKTKNLGGTDTRDYYLAEKKINIKNTENPLIISEEIKVFAKLGSKKEEVGKLMLYKNKVIPKAEIVVVNVITDYSSVASLRDDYQFLFKNQSFNQALIRAEVDVDTVFDLVKLGKKYPNIQVFLNTVNTMSSQDIKEAIVGFYETHGKHKPNSNSGTINYVTSTGTKRTYLFYTTLNAGNVLGSCSLDSNYDWGNSYIIYKNGLSSKTTVVHECGHSLSLPHVFENPIWNPFEFYHGYTDNYMDYDWQNAKPVNPAKLNKGFYTSGDNKNKGKMYSFFKWQWKLLRNDRSLITNY